jgi:MerR family transcriptional regulator, light-induced transcriptional regulator
VERGSQDEPRHPMGVVVQRTGLTPHVLRAWERRYGAVTPGRTEGGQRLYSDTDVVRLRLLKRATEGGRAIGAVAAMPTEEVARLVGEDARARENGGGALAVAGRAGEPEVERALRLCLEAAERLDGGSLRAELMRSAVRVRVWDFVTGVVHPLLVRLGELWEAGALRPAQEHVVSAAVRQVLDWLLADMAVREEGPLLVLGTVAGELHEFGAMLAGVVATDAGWRVLYLGASLPASELALAAERSGARAVGVSVVSQAGADATRAGRELAELRTLLPGTVGVWVGGRGSGGTVPDGATRVEDLDALRGLLAEAAYSGGGGR